MPFGSARNCDEDSVLKRLVRSLIGEEGVLLTHRLRGRLAAFFYGYPARKLKVIGVTGTNGKTTTAFMIARILEESGKVVGMATTVEFRVAKRRTRNTVKMTTLSPFALQRLLKEMVEADCEYAVLEITSHAIKQERIHGIPFDTVVFTNLTHDHLDYHQSFEDYRATKVKLFEMHPHVAVVNADDKSASFFLKPPIEKKITYGLHGGADVQAGQLKFLTQATILELTAYGERLEFSLPIPGKFNVYNALAATGAALGIGVDLPLVTRALGTFQGVPGRMEKVDQGQPFVVYVDYAHTPDAFQQIYATTRPATSGKIIHVFGATGDRDKTKRPLLGAIAAQHADYLVVTDEDPYSEDPVAIMNAVADGVIRASRSSRTRKVDGVHFWKILDRREAIAKALSLAKRGDIVLLTGKGDENVMVVGDEKVPWDDREVAREELAKLGYQR